MKDGTHMTNAPIELPEKIRDFDTITVSIKIGGLSMIEKIEGSDPILVENRDPLTEEEVDQVTQSDGVFRMILAVPVEEFIESVRSHSETQYLAEKVFAFPTKPAGNQYYTIHATVEAYHFIEYGVVREDLT